MIRFAEKLGLTKVSAVMVYAKVSIGGWGI
jgi:hypothetical protein